MSELAAWLWAASKLRATAGEFAAVAVGVAVVLGGAVGAVASRPEPWQRASSNMPVLYLWAVVVGMSGLLLVGLKISERWRA